MALVILAASAFLAMCVATDGDSGVCENLGRYRIVDIDTPEIVGRCDYETMLADAARDYAVRFLSEPVMVTHDGKRDKYGRLLVTIRRGDRDLSAELIERGLARRWTGRRLPWCP